MLRLLLLCMLPRLLSSVGSWSLPEPRVPMSMLQHDAAPPQQKKLKQHGLQELLPLSLLW